MTNDSYLFHIFMDILFLIIFPSLEYMDSFHAKGIYRHPFQIGNIKWINKEIFDNFSLTFQRAKDSRVMSSIHKRSTCLLNVPNMFTLCELHNQ